MLPVWIWITLILVTIMLPFASFVPLPLPIVGLVELRGTAPGWRWPAAWAGAAAAGSTLEAVLTLAIRRNVQTPFSNLEPMDWGAFTLSIGFLIVGATMGWVLVAAARSTRHRTVGGGWRTEASPAP